MKKLICLLGMTACIFTAFAQSADDESLFIIFSPDSAKLQAVSPEQAIQNSKTFTRVAQLLLDNPQYRILIDGHANPVIKTYAEERDQLKPLSEQRAEAAADFLVEYFKVDRHRLIITGAGGRFPSVTREPSLNRRVSFITIIYK
jgi:outer membrane protein OmpA-like peptidoglycan-associated protein